MEVREDDEDFQNPVDLMFVGLKKKKPDHFAGRQYAKFKLAAGKTLKSILVSAGARLAPFDIQEVREITMYDALALDTLGDEKTALFLMMSDTDGSLNFLISMIYTQLFKGYSGKNTDRPEFQKLLGEIRKGKVRRVIVYKLDRISRSILDFANMMELFQEYDVEFVSSTEKFYI